jgi:hypothetical protein
MAISQFTPFWWTQSLTRARWIFAALAKNDTAIEAPIRRSPANVGKTVDTEPN